MHNAEPPKDMVRFITEAAANAPSVLNTQPWWFAGDAAGLTIHADTGRQLGDADPAGREMLISCGAALFTARLALRQLGYTPEVTILPDPNLPTLIAHLHWRPGAPATDDDRKLLAQVAKRRTHRGGFEPDPPPATLVTALRDAARREGAVLKVLGSEERRAALGAVVAAAEHVLRMDHGRSFEQARWAPAPRAARRDGVPATAYPARPAHTEPAFPDRDYARGHGWGIPVNGMEHSATSAGTVTLLTTATDTPADWVIAGQALQRVLLTLTGHGLAAALHSQPLEFPELREFVRRRLAGGYPQLVIRFGVSHDAPASVRRPVSEVLFEGPEIPVS